MNLDLISVVLSTGVSGIAFVYGPKKLRNQSAVVICRIISTADCPLCSEIGKKVARAKVVPETGHS